MIRGLMGTVGFAAVWALVLVGVARPVAAAQEGESVTVEMEEYGGSGIFGTAVLTDSPDGLIVEITLEGNIVGAHPSHFHEGDCSTMDPIVPIYPLADVNEDGTSVTTVPDITLAEVTSVPYVINVHASLAELPVIVTCGNVPVRSTAVPQAGVGSALASGGANGALVAVLGAVAVGLALAGTARRRFENRTPGA